MRGELYSISLPDLSTEYFSYDGDGNLTLYTHPEGFQIGYVYDNAGRLTKIDYPTGVDTTFGYDDASRLTQMVDSTGTTTWGYNNADQVTSLAQPAGTITYDYDDNARPWKMHQPGSLTTTYTYDFAWRLKTITNGFGEQTSFDYDDASRVIKKTLANETYETYSYDPRSRVEWIRLFDAGGELSSHHYTYDPASNVETRTDNGTTTTFGYDDIGQLISESRTGYSATYSYDKNGNRLTRTLDTGSGPTTEVYAYDDADKLLNVKVNGNVVKSFSYDLAGRTTGITDAGGTTSLVYDYEDRVTSISRPGMTTNTFAYNGFGARVSKSDSSGSNTYLRANSGLIGSIVSDSAATYTPGVSEKRGTTSTYYHADIKNSVEQTSTGQGVAASKQYDAFGNEVSSSGPWQGPFQYGGAFGYHTDPDYGLKHLGARYYDSTTGRFLSRDPIKDGRNWYVYCANNPVPFADPSGLAYWEFDGKEMRLVSDNGKRKRVVARIPAASGAPGSTPADQSRSYYGPIPEGTYYVDPNEIGEHVWLEVWPGPNFTGDRDAWGDWRVVLHPHPLSGMDTFGRDGFFLHGGRYIGSAGCIDVGWNDWKVMQLIRLWGDGKPMLVKVRYEDKSSTVPGSKSSPVAWPLGGRE